MISDRCDFNDFVLETKGRNYQEIIYLAEQEALNNEMLNALQSLRQELEETQRLIDLKDAEIAALQGRLSDIESGTGIPAAGEPVAATPVDAPVDAAIEAPLEVPVDPADVPSAAAEPVVLTA